MDEIPENTNNNSTNIPFRLVIKNIPENFSDSQLTEIFNKNFETDDGVLHVSDITFNKLEHRYTAKNNKLCFITVDNFDMRKRLISFFSGFDIVDPKGFKQKLTVVDCLYHTKGKSTKDTIENTLSECKI